MKIYELALLKMQVKQSEEKTPFQAVDTEWNNSHIYLEIRLGLFKIYATVLIYYAVTPAMNNA